MRRCLVLLIAAAACSENGGGPNLCEVRTSLVNHDLWTPVPVESDPYSVEGREVCRTDHDPPQMHTELFELENSYTIETRSCSWGTVQQPSLIAVRTGEILNLRLWYFSQTNFEIAEAELVVATPEDRLLDERVPLPVPFEEAGLRYRQMPAPRDIAVGETLYFHVNNHGVNTWNLLEVSVSRMEPCEGGN